EIKINRSEGYAISKRQKDIQIVRKDDGAYLLKSETLVSSSLDESFEFFASAENLNLITPPWLRFNVVSKPPIKMFTGAQIQYRLRIHRIPVSWRSEIAIWEPPLRFVDRQISGPFRDWYHLHELSRNPSGGTLITDQVEYKVPLGKIAHSMFVGRDLLRIFRFRNQQVEKILS
ncbi:SRPBCC family protein, partial [Candidatus Lucifugimonas marina]|uniref:SRPBCC family protein n=1 Tax=Candidatus Lucifugimonas marina TaxID=3038979 RepID=UPI00319E6F54